MDMVCWDIWVRYTDTDGRKTVAQHRVWDSQRFLAARQQDAANANLKAGDGKRLATAELITDGQYRRERG